VRARLTDGGTPAIAHKAVEPDVPQGLRVLVAEDHPVNQRIVTAFLAIDQHEVTVAANGEEALNAVRQQVFDLVLMDVQMPVMDGLAATRAIRELGGWNGRMPIIALTANAMAGDVAASLSAGMDAHLSKPVDLVKLRKAISEAVADKGRAPEDDASAPAVAAATASKS
jgi:CheY-like chemotaxis protein